MADDKTGAEVELDDKGQPIIPDDAEGAGKQPKIVSKDEEKDGADNVDTDIDTDKPEVPVRKSALQHIIARKNRTIDRLRSKDEDEGNGDDAPPAGDKDDDEDDDLTPQARGAVQKAVAKAIKPVVDTLVSRADEDELKSLIQSDAEAGKYEKRIRAYMADSHYKGVPPSVIYHHLAFEKAAGIGISRKKAADLEADQTRGGGRTNRGKAPSSSGIPTTEDMDSMTDAEFEALQHRVRKGEFAKRDE